MTKGRFFLKISNRDCQHIPPVTTARVEGTEKNGWYNSDVTVTLSATDNLSGVSETVYRIGTHGNWNTYTGPVVMAQEGTYTIQYRSTDKAGNVEDIKQKTVQIDKTPPDFNLIVNGNVLNDGGSFEDCLPLTFKAWDNLSGVASAQISVGGSVYMVDLKTQPSIVIDLAGKAGSYTVTVIAEDNVGNRLEKNFTFTVTTSINSMRHLIDRYVKAGELGDDSPKEMRAVEPCVELVPSSFKVSFAECFDLYYTGVRGARIHAKNLRPKNYSEPHPAILRFHRYQGQGAFQRMCEE